MLQNVLYCECTVQYSILLYNNVKYSNAQHRYSTALLSPFTSWTACKSLWIIFTKYVLSLKYFYDVPIVENSPPWEIDWLIDGNYQSINELPSAIALYWSQMPVISFKHQLKFAKSQQKLCDCSCGIQT